MILLFGLSDFFVCPPPPPPALTLEWNCLSLFNLVVTTDRSLFNTPSQPPPPYPQDRASRCWGIYVPILKINNIGLHVPNHQPEPPGGLRQGRFSEEVRKRAILHLTNAWEIQLTRRSFRLRKRFSRFRKEIYWSRLMMLIFCWICGPCEYCTDLIRTWTS